MIGCAFVVGGEQVRPEGRIRGLYGLGRTLLGEVGKNL
jgi:hypothetical protein